MAKGGGSTTNWSQNQTDWGSGSTTRNWSGGSGSASGTFRGREQQAFGSTADVWRGRNPSQGKREGYGIDASQSYTAESASAMLANLNANPMTEAFYGNKWKGSESAYGQFGAPWNKNYNVTYRLGEVDIAKQPEMPQSPGVRFVSASTWGTAIPISYGRRRLLGNIIYSTDIVPELIGTEEYYIEYEIPVYEDVEADTSSGGFQVDRERPDPDSSPGNQCGDDPCNSRTTSDPSAPSNPPDVPAPPMTGARFAAMHDSSGAPGLPAPEYFATNSRSNVLQSNTLLGFYATIAQAKAACTTHPEYELDPYQQFWIYDFGSDDGQTGHGQWISGNGSLG